MQYFKRYLLFTITLIMIISVFSLEVWGKDVFFCTEGLDAKGNHSITLEIQKETNVVKNADILLSFSASDSMDCDVNGNAKNSPNFLGQTRWDILKSAMDTFIDHAITESEDIRIGIIVYGGANILNHGGYTDQKILMEFTDDIASLKESYQRFSWISQRNCNDGEASLRKSLWGDMGNFYGGLNGEAGFYLANALFKDSTSPNQALIFIGDRGFNRSYGKNGITLSVFGDENAVNAANQCKKQNRNLKIFTVGLGNKQDSFEGLHPSQEKKQYTDGFYTAMNQEALSEVFTVFESEILTSGQVVIDLGKNISVDKSTLSPNVTVDFSGKILWNIGNLANNNKITFSLKDDGKFKYSYLKDISCILVYTPINQTTFVTEVLKS